MMRRFVRVFGLLPLVALVGVSLADAPKVTFTTDPADGESVLTIVVPPVSWESAGGAVVPRIEGFGSLAIAGGPDVPARRERIAIAPGGSLEIVGVSADWAEGLIPDALAPYPALDPNRPQLAADAAGQGGWWPPEAAAVVATDGAFRTLSFATLELRPLQVDSTAKKFRVARSLNVRVRRSSSLAALAWQRAAEDPATEEFAAAVAHGAADVPRGAPPLESGPSLSDAAESLNYPAWQLNVARDGLYRLSYEWAQANAPALLAYLTARDPRTYRLTVQNVEVPIRVAGEADGVFGPGDAVVFYGQAANGDLFAADVYQSGDFTDTNVYRLDTSPSPPRIQDSAFTRPPNSGYPLATSFPFVVRHEENTLFQGFIPADGMDHWYAKPTLVAGCMASASCSDPLSASLCGSCSTGAVCCAASLEQAVSTPDHAGGAVSVKAHQLGYNYNRNYHRSELYVEGVLRNSADWDGFREFTQGEAPPVVFTPASPLAPTTLVRVRLPLGRVFGGSAVTSDTVSLNWFELEYDRLYRALDDSLLLSAGNTQVEVRLQAFTSAPEVWDISASVLSAANMAIVMPKRVPSVAPVNGGFGWALDPDPGAPERRSFAASAGASGYFAPLAVREDRPPSDLDPTLGSTLKAPRDPAPDWVLIGHRSLLDSTPGRPLASLLTHRQSVAGGDHRTAVIDVQDVYDEFTFGIEDPQAIRDFMIHAFANWTPAPRYLLLVGDGTRDYKNFYGHAESRQLVPPQMYDISVNTQFGYYPSDTWFTAVAGMDDLPDATVGRIPAHNLAEAEEVFRKIVQYEAGPNPVSWSGRACLVSEWESTAFTDPHDQVYADWFASGPQIAQKVYETSNSEAASTEANQRIDQCVNAGAALLSFAGHGSYRSWGKTFTMFETYPPAEQVNDDLNDIQAGTPLSFHVHANCITGHFPADTTAGSLNDNWYSFLEDWLLTPGKGVVGGLAPSHLTYLFELDTVLQPFYGEIFGKHKERRVEVLDFRLRSDFDAFNNAAAVRSFILQGDPALRLRVPAPPKPEILSIESAGSGQLLLSWTAVPGVATYRVYRTTVTGGNYQRVAAGLTGTEFLDQGLDNCREYYYYVVGVDADGYESAWSNYNETCNGDRSDCRWGTPQNPNPPAAPVLDSVDDPLTGGRLRVTWHNPNSDANQVVRYRIRWRRMPSGAVEGEQTVGPAVFTTIVGSLENKVEYGVTVSAEHCSGQGPASNERTGIPHRVFGVDPPKAIGDLRVTKVDDASDGRKDLLLEWSAPTETVWGLPGTSVQRYEVHGSSMSPRFPVNASTLLPPAPGLATNWNHEDQGYLTSEDWYYLVVAVDAEGETSAGGIELPAAVSDLRVRRTGGQLALSWTAVSSTMEGDDRPLTISAYNVYGRNSVLPRTECGPVNRLLQTPSPGAYVPEPSGSLYTYQVLAEDSHGTESVW